MSTQRKCDNKACGVTKEDFAEGLSVYFATFPLSGRDVDLCDKCVRQLENWIDGKADIVLKKVGGLGDLFAAAVEREGAR